MDTNIKDNVLFVNLVGELDHHTATSIREEIDRIYQGNRVKHIVFDFEKVGFMDSSGIGLLMGRYRNASIVGGKVMLIKVKPEINKVLNLSGIYKLMNCYANEEEAVANL
ncbi:anti-sigma F factor antagonist [Candidatus Epulonipiscium fishelsonii]|uniref:Anti-sigma F factor antagonist n=1 Tax=Candidatus Epulonipiscium fishelsonii TaxID=77094 RepID=A0ACC8XE79_9FIRM|nr:anti-sigma F factor antagonist [Epulopiscium sp. SCG-B05WGA-EpuloA1]ONI41090.1 anti-sigma F factor antagonist [Epulopiscium sp. SCG-B11WGA-EpuloA1]ONI47414.1 anti-sigma F factor antagonist [Epulopiscium sp. SCG-C06WGA-EpuloA1]